jgi:hypothetical protein
MNILRMFFYFIIILALISCQSSDKQVQDSTQKFLDLFERIEWKELQIYSPSDEPDGNKFLGLPIPKTYHDNFKIHSFLYKRLKDGCQLFASYKIELNDQYIGLFVRQISQYSETSITMYVFDITKQKIISYIELADSFGDGMWFFSEDGWLLDLNNDYIPDLVKKKNEWWEDDDENTHTKSTIKVYLFSDSTFTQSDVPIDTSKYKVFGWSF